MDISINKGALAVSMLYFLCGICWVFFLDKGFSTFKLSFGAIGEIAAVQVYLAVSLTALLIYGIITCYSNRSLKSSSDLRRIEARHLALLHASTDLLLMVNREGLVFDSRNIENPRFYLPTQELIGKKVTEVLPTEIASNYLHYIGQAVKTGIIQVYEYRLDHNGNEARYETRIIPSGCDEVLIIIREIAELSPLQVEWEFLSLRDTLTGLYNRRYFEREMLRISTDPAPFAGIVVCDVDGLKFINDTFGHPAGDDLIKAVATAIRSCFRAKDVVARLGGDEFAVIVNGAESQIVEQASARISRAVVEYNKSKSGLPVSVSVGWAVPSETCREVDALFREADNLMYREKLHHGQNQRNEVVQALIVDLEARDYITEGHGERLQDLVTWLAKSINLPDSICADLRLFSKFHDIGKVGIPDTILFKPSKLTSEEYTIMQRHCEIGYRIAQSAPDLAPIAEWVLKHHEWWDGGGYPLGLKREEIPVECRILALADAYDAMTQDRPYRKAMGYEKALAEIRRCAGKQFDPSLTESFIEMIIQRADPII